MVHDGEAHISNFTKNNAPIVTLVDYGLGNINAFINIYTRLNILVKVASTASELDGAKKLILPGVGAFDWAMHRLNESGMRDRLDDLVLINKVPVLGVCVGMQIMAKCSEEGSLPGLGWIDAEVRRFDTKAFQSNCALSLPHMGWNNVRPIGNNKLFFGISNPSFYFLHSYFFSPRRAENEIANTYYGCQFVSAAAKENIMGVQFHPEKSHSSGIQLLKNFADSI